MAPFPSRRHSRTNSNSLLPTIHSSTASFSSYPPLPSSNATSPADSPRASFSTATQRGWASKNGSPEVDGTSHPDQAAPRALFGEVAAPSGGVIGGLGGVTHESREACRRCLEENHLHAHTFFNDKGFHNHCAHHLLAAYSLGASPSLLEDILKLHQETAFKPMPPLVPVEVHEANWTEHLGDERFYPNYLKFFTRLISTPPGPTSPYTLKGHKTNTVPVLEYYLLGGHGEMLLRAVSGAIHPLIHIGHGVEFGLDALVAEGLAQCAVHKPVVAQLFPSWELGTTWPPQPPKPSGFGSSLSSAFSGLRLFSSSSQSASSSSAPSAPQPAGVSSAWPPTYSTHPIADGRESVSKTAFALPRSSSPDDQRYPRAGLSGFTILDRILHDEALAPGRACSLDAMPKLDAVSKNEEAAARLRAWCDEWKFSTQASSEGWEESAGRDSDSDEDVEGGKARRKREEQVRRAKMKGYGAPKWTEIVEKYEELVWMSTVLYAATTRPGYKKTKLDFFIMHSLTSVLFLPPILQAISPHLRPYLLVSHFRTMVAYWVSRGRAPLYIADTLMAAPSRPVPPTAPSPSPAGETAIARALRKAQRKHSSGSSQASSRASSPPPGGSHDGYLDSPLTPKAADKSPLPFSEEAEGANGQHGLGEGELGAAGGREEGSNPWMRVLQSAVDHDDEHVTKAIRSLYYAAVHFGSSPRGMYQATLPGVNQMDGTIFIRAAGLTLSSIGWAHENVPGNMSRSGGWDRSGLGWPETWKDDELLPGHTWPPASFAGKGKSRASSPSRASAISPSNSPYQTFSPTFAPSNSTSSSSASAAGSNRSFSRTRSGTVVPADEEVVQFSAGDSALLSPRIASSTSSTFANGVGGSGASSPALGSPRASGGYEHERRDQQVQEQRQGWRKVGEEVSEEEERERVERLKREEEERELMA
ncbi:hypothetical protein JCM6882_008438 [Rhodosporidiobolus microsporus]